MKYDKILVKPGTKVDLKEYDTAYTGDFKDKESAKEKLNSDIGRLCDLQYKLYASNAYSLLIVFQALDAAGKDGTINML